MAYAIYGYGVYNKGTHTTRGTGYEPFITKKPYLSATTQQHNIYLISVMYYLLTYCWGRYLYSLLYPAYFPQDVY